METFYRLEFSGRVKAPILRRNKIVKWDIVKWDRNNKTMCDNTMPSRGRVSNKFIKQNNITIEIISKDYVGWVINDAPAIDNFKACFDQ